MKLLAALTILLKGTSTIYYGEEIGMVNVPVPKEQRQDPIAKAKFPVNLFYRDQQRTPMQWSPDGGFSTHAPWLPYGDCASCNVEQQLKDENSILNFYKKILLLKNTHESLQIGELQFVDISKDVICFKRVTDAETILVMLNFGKTGVKATAKCVLLSSGYEGGMLEQFGVLVAKVQK